MSILIKGMAMPKRCEECPMSQEIEVGTAYNGVGCRYTLMIGNPKIREKSCSTKPSWCPLIELPPHGDLIDRRKLPLAFVDVTDLPIDRCLPVYLQEDVDSAPIVVESEE